MKKSIKHEFTHEQRGSTYWEWVAHHCRYNSEDGTYNEPVQSSPDSLPESAGYFYRQDENTTERDCMKKALLRVLQETPPEDRLVIGQIAQGKTLREIAKNLKLSKGKVESVLRRLKDSCRQKAKSDT